uniref:Uncharacterized protein n=1 Tax=Arundo donax TaxID=35708 RepID=A0A0A9FYD5_ARUDO
MYRMVHSCSWAWMFVGDNYCKSNFSVH